MRSLLQSQTIPLNLWPAPQALNLEPGNSGQQRRHIVPDFITDDSEKCPQSKGFDSNYDMGEK
jgi:hypothetical protein